MKLGHHKGTKVTEQKNLLGFRLGIFLVCIVLIIDSELDIVKKSLTTREITNIELNFCKQISVQVKKLGGAGPSAHSI